MSDHPMLFSGPMVRALLDGRKTQTRRVLRVQPSADEIAGYRIVGAVCDPEEFPERPYVWLRGDDGSPAMPIVNPPAYLPDDRLWVREGFVDLAKQPMCDLARSGRTAIAYRATDDDEMTIPVRWSPSIHMPRWASRLTLIVTDVRVQRLQDIGEDDAIAEGCRPFWDYENPSEHSGPNGTIHRMAPLRGPVVDFHRLWDSLNAERAPWDSNPWVCAVSFTVQQGNIDQIGGAA